MSEIAGRHPEPFRILVSTLISLRTQDRVTTAASNRLFARAATPEEMARLSAGEIAELIYPAGFYNTKARNIGSIARTLTERYRGKVPTNRDELLKLPGVGRKTANLVLGLGFGTPAICVDTHVHRIANRLGLVSTRTPEQTEWGLEEEFPRDEWTSINELFVRFGQRICTPVSPWCSRCPLFEGCPRVGVERSR
ncbi:MAG: endonuclease III domain-containing protein [Spirochaetaceae bacterium]